MKKRIAGLFLATTMIVAGSVAGFAEEKTFTVSGSVPEITIDVTVPTSGTLTLNPVGKDQVKSSPAYFANNVDSEGKSKAADSALTGDDLAAALADATTYNITLAGYTATATAAEGDSDNAITFKAAATAMNAYGTSTKKEMYMAIQMGAAADYTYDTAEGKKPLVAYDSTASDAAADIKTKDAAFKALFDAEGAIKVNEVVAKKAEADYTAGGTYTKITPATAGATTVTVAPGKAAPVRITGTMNPMGVWKKGDTVKVTPIFNVTVNVPTATE